MPLESVKIIYGNFFLVPEDQIRDQAKLPKNGPCKMCGSYSTNCYICDAAVCDNNHLVCSSKTMGHCDRHLIVKAVRKTLCSVIYTAELPAPFVPKTQQEETNQCLRYKRF